MMPRTATSEPQDDVNHAVYNSRRIYRRYLSISLTASETACFSKYQTHLAGRDVLDIGVGAGRTARYLAPLARRYQAVDYSCVMVGYMTKTMPAISIQQADFRNLNIFGDSSFDFVLATDNVIDALCHQDRMQALREASRVLRPGGILAVSSHNLRYKKAFSSPQFDWSLNPVRLPRACAKYVFSWWNHLRVGRLRRITPDYALINDTGHHYACLHYYASLCTVKKQLANCGMRLIEVFDRLGRPVDEAGDVSENPNLLYVAEREVEFQ
jgi:ubiquinone/menaquinone biosynthesis C-methylase UbiE